VIGVGRKNCKRGRGGQARATVLKGNREKSARTYERKGEGVGDRGEKRRYSASRHAQEGGLKIDLIKESICRKW